MDDTMGTEVRPPVVDFIHRGPTVNEPFDGPEPQVGDVAAALLNLAPPDRRLAIRPLLAMIESVIADGELDRADRSMILDSAWAPRRRTGRVPR